MTKWKVKVTAKEGWERKRGRGGYMQWGSKKRQKMLRNQNVGQEGNEGRDRLCCKEMKVEVGGVVCNRENTGKKIGREDEWSNIMIQNHVTALSASPQEISSVATSHSSQETAVTAILVISLTICDNKEDFYFVALSLSFPLTHTSTQTQYPMSHTVQTLAFSSIM